MRRWCARRARGKPSAPGARHSKPLLALGAVLRPALLAAGDSTRIQRAAHDVVAHARKILHAAPADEHDRVLLEVVTLPRDVGRDLDTVRQPDAGHLAEGRVRLLGRG